MARRTIQIFERGDWLVASRFGYLHHGIYAGRGTVIAFLRGEGVVRQSYAAFANGATVRRGGRPRFSGDETLRRAEAQLGLRGYHALRLNCEHFARWCATGETESEQVAALAVAAGVGLAAACVMVQKPLLIGSAAALVAWFALQEVMKRRHPPAAERPA